MYVRSAAAWAARRRRVHVRPLVGGPGLLPRLLHMGPVSAPYREVDQRWRDTHRHALRVPCHGSVSESGHKKATHRVALAWSDMYAPVLARAPPSEGLVKSAETRPLAALPRLQRRRGLRRLGVARVFSDKEEHEFS